MANSLVWQSLFFIFVSGVVFFAVLALLAYFGNPVLFIENYQYDKQNNIISEEKYQRRIILQYFVAAIFDLFLAIICLILSLTSKKGERTSEPKYENENENENDKEEDNLISTDKQKPQEVQTPVTSDNVNVVNNEGTGMSEAEPINP